MECFLEKRGNLMFGTSFEFQSVVKQWGVRYQDVTQSHYVQMRALSGSMLSKSEDVWDRDGTGR